jgi:ankyrin repeat protein
LKDSKNSGELSGQSALAITARNGNYNVLNWYVETMFDTGHKDELHKMVELRTQDGLTPLFLACYMGYKNEIEEEDAAIVKQNRLLIVRTLCERGAEVNF